MYVHLFCLPFLSPILFRENFRKYFGVYSDMSTRFFLLSAVSFFQCQAKVDISCLLVVNKNNLCIFIRDAYTCALSSLEQTTWHIQVIPDFRKNGKIFRKAWWGMTKWINTALQQLLYTHRKYSSRYLFLRQTNKKAWRVTHPSPPLALPSPLH